MLFGSDMRDLYLQTSFNAPWMTKTRDKNTKRPIDDALSKIPGRILGDHSMGRGIVGKSFVMQYDTPEKS